MRMLCLALAIVACAQPSAAPRVDAALEARLRAIAGGSDGRLGVCAIDTGGVTACVNGDQRFSMQSVVKLLVGAAALDAVDRGELRLDQAITVRPADLSLNVQPIADLVRANGEFTTTVDDLIVRAVTQSDSAATDVLIARLGGPAAIQAFLKRKGHGAGIRVDRDERHLQAETAGLAWRIEFTDPARYAQAQAALSDVERATAFRAYLADPRDTASPAAMARFLRALADGDLLSPASTARLLAIMAQTRTFPTRLRAGAPKGWTVSHKTGTGPTRDGLNSVSNDVGILTAPGGRTIAIAAFYAETRAPEPARDAMIASSAAAVTAAFSAP